jgi:single-stranded-DNA-specific exonuclease
VTRQLSIRSIEQTALTSEEVEDDLIFRILASRGVKSTQEVDYDLKHLMSPASIHNLFDAAELLVTNLVAGNPILIFGDYDADGATSTALCIRGLDQMHCDNLEFLIPDRMIDGYGLSVSAADRIIEISPALVVTVDNGVASFAGIKKLRDLDIDVIVTDHHLPADSFPDANVIVNQNAFADVTMGKNLAGVGIAFYLMLAVRQKLRQQLWFTDLKPEPNLANYLDLVALGTIADLVPLDYQNRLLVNAGIQRMKKGVCCPGIKALVHQANKNLNDITSTDLAFIIGPRINAAGRLEDMRTGVLCLLANDDQVAEEYADYLSDVNQQRKMLQEQMNQEALEQIDRQINDKENTKLSVLYDENWHEGVIGIVAARVREKQFCPSIVFAGPVDGQLKGSGRSIPGVHLRDILDLVDKRHPGLILKFGGHAMAAGLTINHKSLANFEKYLHQVIVDQVAPDCFSEVVLHDGPLRSENLTLEYAQKLNDLGPWGQKFPLPGFVGDFQVQEKRILSGKHLKFVLSNTEQSVGTTIDAIAFNQSPDILQKEFDNISLHYELAINRFRNNESVQLIIRDILD